MLRKILKRMQLSWVLIFILVGVLWNTPVVYPLKILVVFLHELSHGIAAVATGGRIEEIVVVPEEGGHTLTIGGSRFWTLSAGYLGSLVWGGLILVIAARTHLDKLLSVVIGSGIIIVSIIYGGNPFIYLFGIAFGGGLILVGGLLSESINDWVLRVIGFTSCLYAILDIKSDVLDRSGARSDARMLHEELTPMIPTVAWGILWIIIAIIGTIFFLYVSGGNQASPKVDENDD